MEVICDKCNARFEIKIIRYNKEQYFNCTKCGHKYHISYYSDEINNNAKEIKKANLIYRGNPTQENFLKIKELLEKRKELMKSKH